MDFFVSVHDPARSLKELLSLIETGNDPVKPNQTLPSGNMLTTHLFFGLTGSEVFFTLSITGNSVSYRKHKSAGSKVDLS
jgi:hypothetical protein